MTANTNTVAECPWCQKELKEPVDAEIENAGSFCPHCAAPLFWAPSDRVVRPAVAPRTEAVSTPVDPKTDPSRRWPELRGVRSDASVPCWRCLEPNQQLATECHRCGATIPIPAVTGSDAPGAVPLCGTASGARARPRIEVKAWILVVLGIVLVALTLRLIWLVWW